MTTSTSATPRIFVTSLADSKAGRLHGRWIDANQSADAVLREIAAMRAASRDPLATGWVIHGHMNFNPLKLSGNERIEDIVQTAHLMEEHGEVFAHLLDHLGGFDRLEEAKVLIKDGYHGEFTSVAGYAEELVESCYGHILKNLPDFIRHGIDFKRIGSELEQGGDIIALRVGRETHVFEGLF